MNVTVRYSPKLTDEEIRREAVRMVTKQQEAAAAEEFRLLQLKQKQDEAQAAAVSKVLKMFPFALESYLNICCFYHCIGKRQAFK